jgi:hypothetical protein
MSVSGTDSVTLTFHRPTLSESFNAGIQKEHHSDTDCFSASHNENQFITLWVLNKSKYRLSTKEFYTFKMVQKTN